MSGGCYGYHDISLKNEIGSDDFEDIEVHDLVMDVLDLIHDYDWYQECDTSREDYLKAKDEFKKKWFHNPDRRLKMMFSTIISSLNSCKNNIENAYKNVTDERD